MTVPPDAICRVGHMDGQTGGEALNRTVLGWLRLLLPRAVGDQTVRTRIPGGRKDRWRDPVVGAHPHLPLYCFFSVHNERSFCVENQTARLTGLRADPLWDEPCYLFTTRYCGSPSRTLKKTQDLKEIPRKRNNTPSDTACYNTSSSVVNVKHINLVSRQDGRPPWVNMNMGK